MNNSSRRLERRASSGAGTRTRGNRIRIVVDQTRITSNPDDVVTFGRGTSVTSRMGAEDLQIHRLVDGVSRSNEAGAVNRRLRIAALALQARCVASVICK